LSLDDEPVETGDEDDGQPYLVEGGEQRLCPHCHKPLEADAVVCVACGFHLRKRKKVARTYEPLVRSWETNVPLRQRLAAFLAIQGPSLVAGVLGAVLAGGGLLVFLGTWFCSGMMLAFLLGTYERLDLTRDRRGRVNLTRTWRICFVPLQPAPIEVRGYEGLVNGRADESGFWEWFIFLTLLPAVLPALIWWYYTIHKVTYHVALARDHGYPEVYLYKGRDEALMNDIAATVRDAAGLHWEQG